MASTVAQRSAATTAHAASMRVAGTLASSAVPTYSGHTSQGEPHEKLVSLGQSGPPQGLGGHGHATITLVAWLAA